ncbi:uncharacterized protein LOC107056682 isoform X1 [Gallus gallus]|uniref:uncharacterized protein LOC107056682 isoform X1 n=1 Tax=Gallus gallus TaxID=9031 RepID=UPI001AE2E04C|nr:uncharacterized protein LOC107056682 isoform X1 [Gallus gallus]
MSEEREKKDDSQPDTGLPRVQDRRQVRAGEGGGGRARQRGEAVRPGRLWPGDALAWAARRRERCRRAAAARARPSTASVCRRCPARRARGPPGAAAHRYGARGGRGRTSRRVGTALCRFGCGGRGGSRPRAERCPRCSVEREREGPRSLGVSPRLLLQAGGWEFTLSVTCGSASGQRRQPQPPLLPRLRQARMPAAAPWRAAASSNARKLPALQAAASCTPSARGSARAMGIRGSRLPVLAPRPQQPPEMPCSCDTCSAKSVSVPRLLVPQAADDGASAANTAQGKPGVCSATSRAEGQVPAPGGSRTRDVGVQTELQVLEEAAEKESTGWSSGQLWSASLASSDEEDPTCSASLLAADAGPGGHLEPLPGTGPEDGESSTSSKAEYFPEETNAAPRFWRPWEGEETATTTPEFSNQSLGEAQRLQDPGEAYGEVYGYPPVHPAIRRIRDEARKDQMRSSWNTSWPNSMSVPQLLRPQAAEDGANAADSALGTLRACSVTSRAEGQFSASDDSPARDVTAQDSQLELEETAGIEMAGQSSGTLQAASLSPSDEAHAVCSPSLLDAGPGPAGHLEPLPASVLEDAESSDSPEAASSAEEADGASLPLSVSEGGAREEPAVAMPESSGQGLGEARRLQDPREINRETYGCSPMIPALRRIREQDRNERMLSHWDISWPRNVRSPRQQRLQARGDAFNTAGTAQGMPGIRPKTSRAAVRFPDSGDSRVWSPRLSVVQEESSDDSDSAVSTAEGMQDARDTAVTDKGTHPPSCLCPSPLEAVEDDWECDSEEDAASEAVSVTPSTSDDSSAEVESTSSASSVAADPRPEEHVSACEGADVGPQHEVSAETGEGAQSSVCFRDAPEEGPGTAAAPHAAARRRMPAVVRMALRALRRVFTCSCIRGQREERHEAANTRQLPETED